MRALIAACLFAALAGISDASAMTYRAVAIDDGTCGDSCPAAVMATGPIEVDEHARFARFIAGVDTRNLAPLLVLHSPGGNVAGSIRLGFLARRLGIRMLVGRLTAQGVAPGTCASACVYVFMGGAERRLVPGSRLAVHAARSIGITQRDILGAGTIDAQSVPGSFDAAMREYAQTMGVSPALIDLASSVPHETAHVLTPSEISSFRLVTGAATKARRVQSRPERRRSARAR